MGYYEIFCNKCHKSIHDHADDFSQCLACKNRYCCSCAFDLFTNRNVKKIEPDATKPYYRFDDTEYPYCPFCVTFYATQHRGNKECKGV